MLGRVGVRFLYELGQPPKTFISYSLLYVNRVWGENTLMSFMFILCHAISVVCINKEALILVHLSEPLKKRF